MPGMRDVAKKSGVSLSTVSAVLSDSGKFVSDEIRKKVLKAVNDLGYVMPERRKKRDKIIAVILPNVASIFFSNLLSAIEDAAAEENYVLLVGNSNFDFAKEKRIIKMLKRQALCGVLIDTICPYVQEQDYFFYIKKSFISRDIPVVMLERSLEEYGFGCVYVDHEKNAYMATKALLDVGNKKIAHISGKLSNPLSVYRLQGYKRALKEYGISFSDDLVAEGDFTPSSGYIKAKELMFRNRGLNAIFAANDQMAIGAIKAILSEGRRIPDEFAVSGLDNISASSLIEPSLTTINVPMYQMGRVAVKMLINPENEEKSIELPCNLIVRKSTCKSASSDWELFGW